MKRYLMSLSAIALTATAGNALAADPRAEVCAFAQAIGRGTDEAINQLQSMASVWGEADRAKLDPVMRPEFSKFEMVAGKVYLIADLDPFAQEFLLVTASPNAGRTLYFRIIYETGPNGYFFKNVNFNSDYYKIMSNGILQTPAQVDC